MKIEAYSVVTLKYTLKDKHGNVVDLMKRVTASALW